MSTGEIKKGIVEFNSTEEEEDNKFKEMQEVYNTTGYTAEFEIKLKKYSKKRFKKLLIAQGIQKNDAEIFAIISGDKKSPIKRDDFGLIVAKDIMTAWNFKRKKVEK